MKYGEREREREREVDVITNAPELFRRSDDRTSSRKKGEKNSKTGSATEESKAQNAHEIQIGAITNLALVATQPKLYRLGDLVLWPWGTF